jgi:Flp pilus assembly protein TadD
MHSMRRIVVVAIAAALLSSGCRSAPYLRQRGREAFDVGQYGRAEQLYSQAVERDPSNWSAHYHLGLAHLEQNRPLDAQTELELALSVRPENPAVRKIHDGMAEAFYQQKDAAALHGLLRQACDEYGTSYEFLRQAKYMSLMGDSDNARIALRKAMHFAAPGDAAPYLATADFYDSIGDEKNAVIALRRALYLKPDSEKVHNRLRDHGVIPGPTIALPPGWE